MLWSGIVETSGITCSFSLDLWQFSTAGPSSLPSGLQLSSGVPPQSWCVEDDPSMVLAAGGGDLKR